jgi:hypothetical protein
MANRTKQTLLREQKPFVPELPASSCAVVCSGSKFNDNRCIVAAGLRTNASSVLQLAIAYYCLPLDVSQYAFQWPGMESDSVQGSGLIYAQLPGTLVSVHVATTWGAQQRMRDSLIAHTSLANFDAQ